jgi:hypothetical protein
MSMNISVSANPRKLTATKINESTIMTVLAIYYLFDATISNISVILLFGQFYWWRKPEYLQKITDKDLNCHIPLAISISHFLGLHND